MKNRSLRYWRQWLALVPVTLIAVSAVWISAKLHEHADHRRAITEEIAEIERLSVEQSGLVWRALTLLQVDERMDFIRLRGQEQQRREELQRRIAGLHEIEVTSTRIDRLLGYEPLTEWAEELDHAGRSFLGGVQGAFGQMNLSPERMRKRLSYWDMNFGQFQEVLDKIQARDEEIAKASASIAGKVNTAKAIITLFASALLVLRISRIRSQRERDLQAERLTAVAASEARFRQLVQNSSDLILVAEPTGQLRYATPSAQVLADSRGRTSDVDASEAALSAARSIERAIAAGALDSAEVAVDAANASIEDLLGVSLAALVDGASATEVAFEDATGQRRVLDVVARDLSAQPDIRGIVINARDVTERKVLEEQLRHQALHDPLTNLPNRRRFKEHFDALDAEARAHASVLFVDLDGFKLVNDSYGHGIGDELLVAVAHRIGSCLRFGDLLARQGGDEFLILYNGETLPFAESIEQVLAPPFRIGGSEIFITASIGIVTDLSDLDAEAAAQRADIAMYEAKRAGKARATHFSDAMLEAAPERLALERDFRRALEREEFTVLYQPKVGLESGRTESLEALVRWIHPERGFVGPDVFIPFAEETGLIAELGRQILERACLDAVRWQDDDVVVAVNLSPIQFRNPRLVDEVRDALAKSGLRPENLELEITESAVLGDIANTIRVLNELKGLGVRLAIDDFGTGYSNLAHLKHFNVDVLKIDQAFVRGGKTPTLDRLSDGAIVEAVIGMAKAFGMHVVAEGVESEHHVRELRTLGADLAQGYFFSKPVAGTEIDTRIQREREAFEKV